MFHCFPEYLRLHAWILSGDQLKQWDFWGKLVDASQSLYVHVALQVQSTNQNGNDSHIGAVQGNKRGSGPQYSWGL